MLLIVICYAIFAFGFIFVICELSQRGTDAINDFDYLVGQIDWYLYSNKMKKMLPMIMNLVGKQVKIKCFGNIACDRESFKNVSVFYKDDGNMSMIIINMSSV